MEDIEVPLPGPRFAVEPDLLAQQADEDDADAKRPREPGEIPRNAVAERMEQEAEQAEDPDERGEQEVPAEGIARGVTAQTAPQRPHAGGGEHEIPGAQTERREAPAGHGRQQRPHVQHRGHEHAAENDHRGADGEPAAARQRKAALTTVRGQADAGQAREVAEEEEVRRDARVDPGVRRIVGLGEDVRQREQRGQPQRGAHAGGPGVLAQTVTLETQITDANGHQCERHVEDRHRVGRGKARHQRAPAGPDEAFVEHADGHVEQHHEHASPEHHCQFLFSAWPRSMSSATIAALSRRGSQDCLAATMRTALGRSRDRSRSARCPHAPRRTACRSSVVDARRRPSTTTPVSGLRRLSAGSAPNARRGERAASSSSTRGR